ncbi:MAG: 4Fe-4S binding protein [Bryobacteraceae bacterium]
MSKEFSRRVIPRDLLAGSAVSIRHLVQYSFLALNVWIGVQFYLWVRYHETGGQTLAVDRPPGVEGWLPIASLMNWKYWFATGEFPGVHPAGMFLLAAFVLSSLLLRKAFCGWLCPVGTVSEFLWKFGRSTFKRVWHLPKWADLPLRSLKYILMAFFLYAAGAMSATAIRAFLDGPYGIVADVKMLNFFRYLSVTGAVVVGSFLVLSIFIPNFWCRYLCPYGALMGLFSWASPLRITRNASTCIDCAKCARACPADLAVDKLIQIQSPECLGCFECVDVCPVESTLDMTLPGKRPVKAWTVAAGAAAIFLGFVTFAQTTGHWHTRVPDSVYRLLVPQANELDHPR